MASRRPWLQVPVRRAPAWYQLSSYARRVGLDLFVALEGQPAELGSESGWERAICRLCEVDGRERPAFSRALRAIRDAGLLSMDGGTLRLSLDGSSGDVRSTSGRRESDVRSTSDLHEVDVRVTSGRRESNVRSTSGLHEMSDNPAESLMNGPRAVKKERKKERKKDARASAPARQEPVEIDGLPPLARSVRRAFSERYLAARVVPWAHDRYRPELEQLAGWLGQLDGDADEHVRRLVDGFFRDSYAAERGYPMGLMAKDPGRYHSPPSRVDREAELRETMAQARERARARMEAE